MTDHPLLPAEIKAYMEQHQLESAVNKAVNGVLSEFPQDPFSSMAVILMDSNPASATIDRLEARETFLMDLAHPSLQIDVYLNVQGASTCQAKYVHTYNHSELEGEMTWDDPDAKQGMSKACQIITEELSVLLAGKDLLQFKKIGELLHSFKAKYEATNWVVIGANVLTAVQQALFYAFANAGPQDIMFKNIFKHNALRDFRPETDPLPKLMFTVLNGGKEAGSKVRFAKFFLIFDVKPDDLLSIDVREVYFKANAAIEKGLTATKGGLAAFKRGPDGSFFNAFETINDSFKLLEDAINAVGINTAKRQYLKIGVNTDAQSFYLEEQSRYDWEGPKNLWDQGQLIEFYNKLISDHPLLEYFEDCFGLADIQGYKKFTKQLKESHEGKVQVGVKALFQSDLNIIKEFTQLVQQEKEEEECLTDPSKKSEQAKTEAAEEVTSVTGPEKEQPKEPAKDEKQAAGKPQSRKGKKGTTSPQLASPTAAEADLELAAAKTDPNYNKYIPNVIHVRRDLMPTVQTMLQLIAYCKTMKKDEQSTLVFEDAQVDSVDGDLVDFVFGAGVASYLNISGMGKPEKFAKVERFQVILEQLLKGS